MDKARDVKRRGASRFKHSKPKFSSGLVTGVREDFVGFSEKSRREKKLRKLSSVGGKKLTSSHEDWEMDSLGTSRDEDDTNSSIRFKLSDKYFDDCNGVGHASVPRRLRTAMKKRSGDPISPRVLDSKKLKNHMSGGTNSTKTDVVKKSKSNVKQGASDRFSRRIVSGPITKDEEEVAETLFALARMFPNNDTNDDFKGKHESLEPNPSGVPDSNNSHSLAVEERNGSSICPLMAAEATVPSSSAEILPETVKVESSNELNLSHPKKIHLPPDDSIPPINQQASSLSAKTEMQSGSVKYSIQLELHLDAGLKQAQQNEAPFVERKPGTALGIVMPIGSQMETPKKVESSKITGLALWPGLPSTSVSRDARVDDPLPSSTSKFPAWLDVAYSNSRSSSLHNSFAKVSTCTADKKLSKRSAIHVYISRLIQALRTSENKVATTTAQKPYERLNQGVLSVISNFNGVVNGVNEVVSTSNIEIAVAKQSPNGAKNVVLQQKLHHDHPQPAVASAAVSNWQKQSFDFFMPTARGSGMEVNDGSDRARNGLDPLSPLQNPYLPSFVQHQFGMSYSLPQPCYISSASPCSDQFSSAQQLPSYTMPFDSARASPTTALTKHHQQQRQQQQKQQQRLWDAHYRTNDTPKTTFQFLNLPNGATSQRPQQQQHLMPVVPSQFSPEKVARQEHHLPSVYDERGGGFRTSALPLQLLCNERLC